MARQDTITPDEKAEAAFERRMEAVTAVIDLHHGYLLNYLYGLTKQWQDAENLLQDLWRYVLLRFEEDQIGSLPLLRRKAYQLFIDHYRKLVRRGETLSESPPETPTRPMSPEASTDAEEAALNERFWSEYPGIDFSDEQKGVLWLHARYGFTYAEIAEKTGIATSTACDWIAHARKCLADHINSNDHD